MANTSFQSVYNVFLAKTTDDMYMELFEEETYALLQDLLVDAIPWFEFPRVDLFNYDATGATFNIELTNEEINILATYMVVAWMGQQLASVENTRMKYSGVDFKFTSQANHMGKILSIRETYKQEGLHLQRLYKRRSRDGATGVMTSTFSQIMEEL
jgi:hypothetical protein